ncbi:MAG: hypothetical protein DI529_10805 [Chryseobacterium sp.]|nr:MAG: hypothetical protein DI529_10805 [Chryseobacterium sp.]
MYIFLILIILILSYLLFKPVFARKLNKIEFINYKSLTDIRKNLLTVALAMLRSGKSYMSFNDEDSLYTDLAKIKSRIKGDKSHIDYAFYNFPKAFLMMGILDNNSNDPQAIVLVEKILREKYINSNGSLRFEYDKIDQSLYGLVFIRMHGLTGNDIYKIAAKSIYEKAKSLRNPDGLYLYRESSNVLFIDTLGMIVPFLTEYAKFSNDSNLQKEAELQILEYLKKTTSGKNDLPPHAFDLNNNLKLGSNNWSRGIAWFMLGLAYTAKDNKEFQSMFSEYYNRLSDLRSDKYWPQFFSHDNSDSIDASATIMIYFSASLLGYDVKADLEQALRNSISKDFFVENNTGDTIYINKYSKTKGKSEVSQGLLLSILAN